MAPFNVPCPSITKYRISVTGGRVIAVAYKSVAPAATSCVADSELCNVAVPDETRYTFTAKVESMLEPELSKSMVTAVAQFTSTVTVGAKMKSPMTPASARWVVL